MRTELVTDRPAGMRTGTAGRVTLSMDGPDGLDGGALEPAALLAAFHVLLYKYTWQREIAFALVPTGDEAKRGSVLLRLDPDARMDELVTRAAAALRDPQTGGGDAPSVAFAGRPVDGFPAPQVELTLSMPAQGCVALDYDEGLLDAATARRMAVHLREVLRRVVARPHDRVRAIDPVTDAERSLIHGTFNDTATTYERDMTIHGLFEQQVARTPDAIAVACGERSVSYRQLNAAANGLAARLRLLGVGVDEPCALIGSRDVETIVAVLAILKAGGAYLPIDASTPAERVGYLLDDSACRVLVTSTDSSRQSFGRTVLGLDPAIVETAGDEPNLASANGPTDLAYVMYTSGTTGRPKGVLVSHRNVVRLVRNTNFVRLAPSTRILQTGAMAFDASTFEIWGALLNGGLLCLSPHDDILDPAELARLIAVHRITTMWLTAPLFNRLVDQRPALFEPLRELLVGGDALSPAHVSRALDASPGLVIINGYGPTENTTFSTTHAIEASARGRIPIGRPIANSTAYLLGPDDQLAPIGAVGELCVGGDGLARGYLNRPELTARAFVASPLAEGERLYRTGDLARWRPDGAIEFLGRRDHQVKVRGFRIELGEVEAAVLEHPAVRETVVVARPRPDGADRYLCVYYVADRELQPGDLRAHLAHSLPDHMVASSYMELPALPLNDNGKVDRAALPEPSRAEREPVAPRTELEQRLVAIVEEQLRISGVGVCRDLRDLGMDSLSATVLAAEVERRTGIRPAVSEIVRAGTVEALARHLCAAGASGGPTLARMPRTATIPLSPQQWRIFVEQMKSPGATQYNVPVAVDLPADTDVVRLTRALGDLAARHDVLRTEFHFVDGEVRQRVAPGIVPDVEVRTGKLLASRAFVRPFDLSRAPLWRGLVTRAADRVRLLLDVHHIVIDGFSLAVLFEDLFALYDGVPLSDVAIQYSDYAHWVTGEAGARRRRAQGAHWMAVFAEPTPTLDLPTDFPRAAVRGHDGDVVTFDLGPEQVGGLRRLARHENATLFAVLAAIHAALLARVTGEPDVTVGTPISGRDVPGSGRVVGMFANTVCLRTRVDANMPFVELVRVVSAVADDAARHGDYPFDDLVSDVGARRDDGRHPLFDALIALQSQRYLEVEFRGRRRLELDLTGPTPFDLNLQIYELDGSLRLGWQFASALFHRGTVEAFRDLFLHIVAGALADPGTPVGRLTTAGPAPTLPHIQFNF